MSTHPWGVPRHVRRYRTTVTARRAVKLAMILTAVVCIVWFHRVRVNAGAYAQGAIRGGAGWAIGVWFIPVVGCTVLRCLIALKVWSASASRLSGKATLTSLAPVPGVRPGITPRGTPPRPP
ncbi:DUF4328 domain-containing protein [Streptomyces sp. NPDC002886]|uniref:DUF4328 domain-containing protein n=1 Tax=Streptomyces sp. NPDC002886 TaxID=3364667 RepID=UPI003694D82E